MRYRGVFIKLLIMMGCRAVYMYNVGWVGLLMSSEGLVAHTEHWGEDAQVTYANSRFMLEFNNFRRHLIIYANIADTYLYLGRYLGIHLAYVFGNMLLLQPFGFPFRVLTTHARSTYCLANTTIAYCSCLRGTSGTKCAVLMLLFTCPFRIVRRQTRCLRLRVDAWPHDRRSGWLY